MRAGLTCAQILGRRSLMTLRGKTALVTGGSRGIGRGIALKLAESGAKVAVHYYQKEDQAKATLEKLRALGADGFVVQADVCKPDEIRRMFARVKSEFGSLDIFVNNARPEVPTFYQGPMSISLDMFDFAMDSQAKAFLVGVREAVALLCSAEANWITGQVLAVDGGASLMDAHLPLEIQQIPAAQAHATSL